MIWTMMKVITTGFQSSSQSEHPGPLRAELSAGLCASALCCMHQNLCVITCRNLNHLFASSPMIGIRTAAHVTVANAEGPMAVAGSQQMPELTLERMQVSLETRCGAMFC